MEPFSLKRCHTDTVGQDIGKTGVGMVMAGILIRSAGAGRRSIVIVAMMSDMQTVGMRLLQRVAHAHRCRVSRVQREQ